MLSQRLLPLPKKNFVKQPLKFSPNSEKPSANVSSKSPLASSPIKDKCRCRDQLGQPSSLPMGSITTPPLHIPTVGASNPLDGIIPKFTHGQPSLFTCVDSRL